jgi:hypothetical protein
MIAYSVSFDDGKRFRFSPGDRFYVADCHDDMISAACEWLAVARFYGRVVDASMITSVVREG